MAFSNRGNYAHAVDVVESTARQCNRDQSVLSLERFEPHAMLQEKTHAAFPLRGEIIHGRLVHTTIMSDVDRYSLVSISISLEEDRKYSREVCVLS